MDDRELLKRVLEARQAFGMKCAKFAGAVAVELFRQALVNHGFTLSPRDVFIKGVPVEIDLLMLRHTAKALDGVFYEPSDVLAAFEVKSRGSFGAKSVESIRRSFAAIQDADRSIACIYVALAERRSYKWAVTTATLGHDAFTFLWHKGSEPSLADESSGEWQTLLSRLESLRSSDAGRLLTAAADEEPASGWRG